MSLSKLEWSPDGTRLLCGNSTGHIYEIAIKKEMVIARLEDERKAEDNVLVWQSRATTAKQAQHSSHNPSSVLEDDYGDGED